MLLYLRSGRRYGAHMLFAWLPATGARWLVRMAACMATVAAVVVGTIFAATVLVWRRAACRNGARPFILSMHTVTSARQGRHGADYPDVVVLG